MTPLELHQKALLSLLKGRRPAADDPYLRRVARSRELAMLREIAIWWRKLHVESQCPFTSRLLKRMDQFDPLVSAYFAGNATSPFIEELAEDFLRTLRAHPDPLIRAVSQFEYAFLRVRSGAGEIFEVCWDRHPDQVIRALEEATPLPAIDSAFLYRMRIGPDIAGFLACTREPVEDAAVRSCDAVRNGGQAAEPNPAPQTR